MLNLLSKKISSPSSKLSFDSSKSLNTTSVNRNIFTSRWIAPQSKQLNWKPSFRIFVRQFSTASSNIRNVAIIAHVDHGKTTLVDQLLQQSGTIKQLGSERVMDSNTLEKERGITILSKVTAINWQGLKINLVDTPGHGDFGGEVERILSLVDGVVLVVDALEGVMSQTKFVLSKALQAKKKPIVVLNKMDRVAGNPQRAEEVETEIFDLFAVLDANEDQMGYPTLYASAREGWAVRKMKEEKSSLNPLFDAIVKTIPPPVIKDDPRFSMLVTNLDSDNYLGRMVTGRVLSGKAVVGNKLKAIDLSGKLVEEQKVLKVLTRIGLEKIILDEGIAGDIVMLAGFQQASVSNTICDPEINEPIPSTPLDPPVVSMTFTVNTSPLKGTEGTQTTFPVIRKRLEKEVESNVSLLLKQAEGEALEVCGRGELQLGILIENMRREGFEFTVSPPKVVFKIDEQGRKLEPLEEVIIDVDEEYNPTIIEKLSQRKGELLEMKQIGGKSRLVFKVPARALLGFRNELLTDTRGTAVYNHLFHSYIPYLGQLEGYKKGALISMADGVTSSYALESLEARGVLFVGPGVKVYPGMIIGEHSRDSDLEVNPVKARQVSNVRTVQKDEFVRLTPPKIMSLEESIAYMREGEMLEVTPKSIRLRRHRR